MYHCLCRSTIPFVGQVYVCLCMLFFMAPCPVCMRVIFSSRKKLKMQVYNDNVDVQAFQRFCDLVSCSAIDEVYMPMFITTMQDQIKFRYDVCNIYHVITIFHKNAGAVQKRDSKFWQTICIIASWYEGVFCISITESNFLLGLTSWASTAHCGRLPNGSFM